MSDRNQAPTPEVDALEFDRFEDCSVEDDMVVTSGDARKLEIERDALKAQVQAMCETVESTSQTSKAIAAKALALEAERDALREALEAYYMAATTVHLLHTDWDELREKARAALAKGGAE